MRAMVAHPTLFRWAEGWGFSMAFYLAFCFVIFGMANSQTAIKMVSMAKMRFLMGFSWVSIWLCVSASFFFAENHFSASLLFLRKPSFLLSLLFALFAFSLFYAVSPLCCFLPSALSCCLAFVLSSPDSLFFNFYALMFSCVCSVMLICFLCFSIFVFLLSCSCTLLQVHLQLQQEQQEQEKQQQLEQQPQQEQQE